MIEKIKKSKYEILKKDNLRLEKKKA